MIRASTLFSSMARGQTPRPRAVWLAATRLAAAGALLLLLAVSALAQTAEIDQANTNAQNWTQQVEEIQAALDRPGISEGRLSELRAQLEQLRTQIQQAATALRPRLEELNASLNQLGPPPETGTEPPDIANQRQTLRSRRERVESIQKQLDLLTVRTEQLSERAAGIQHTRFFRMVFDTSRSAVNPLLWVEAAQGLGLLAERMASVGESTWSRTVGQLDATGMLLLVVKIVAAIAAGIVARMVLSWLLGPNLANPQPSMLERLWRVFRSVLVDGGCTLLVVALLYLALGGGAATQQAQQIYWAVTIGIAMVVAFFSFTARIYAPREPHWRLVVHSDAVALRVKSLFDVIAVVVALDFVFQRISEALLVPVQLSIGQSATTAIVIAVLVVVALITARPDREQADDEEASGHFGWAERVIPLYWAVPAIIVLALLLGFIALADFIARQVFIISTLTVALYLLHRLSDELVTDGLKAHRPMGRFVRHVMSLREATVDRLGVVISTLVDFVLVFIGLPVIFLQTAVTWIDLQSWVNSAFFGFQVGGVTISLSTVAAAILAFLIGLGITRIFTRWLDSRVLSRTQINKGIRDSIKTGAGYIGFLFAAVFALSYAGVNFDNIALIAGALGVGIGFGLQSIVNNFVSGLILLAERPIKVGDWIKVTGGEGYVKRINVRSTEIETFERCAVIVPNSNLISEPVQNWTHSDTMGRVTIKVGVSYDSDADKVRDILFGCVRSHDKVLAFPAPAVYFVEFGDSALEFLIFAYIADVNAIFTVSSDLRFAILHGFRESGVEIPFPQRDIRMRDSGSVQAALEQERRRVPKARETSNPAPVGDEAEGE